LAGRCAFGQNSEVSFYETDERRAFDVLAGDSPAASQATALQSTPHSSTYTFI
jgi:hypothetical protein